MADILQIARSLGLSDDAIEARGRGVLKVDPDLVPGAERGRVVLVTAMTPTPAGEGKTTTTIGLVDGLRRRGVKAVGALRGSPPEHRRSHALRLAHSPVPYRGLVLRRPGDGAVMACGQVATEAPLAGLYDVFTHPEARNQGLARLLCEHLLSLGASLGATMAYLQVDAANDPALAVYRRLGFVDGYGYQYLERAGA